MIVDTEGNVYPVPDLDTGLIPVVYDFLNKKSTGWFVADTSKRWYDYDRQVWANAVSVGSTTSGIREKYVNDDGTFKKGVEIDKNDLLAMFVWIPRFEYTIGCHETDKCYGYRINDDSDKDAGSPSSTLPGAIDIRFVSKNEPLKDPGISSGNFPTYSYSSSSRDPDNWYTHPAFNFDGEAKTGIWVGKFETTGYKTDPTILPNKLSLVSQNIFDQFTTAKYFAKYAKYGLAMETNSHMMKNSEWASFAYLSDSNSGNSNVIHINATTSCSDSDGVGLQTCTGRSAGYKPSYADVYGNKNYKYYLEKGRGASTTGNIYGIYDMSGGAIEYVMANWKNKSNLSYFDFSSLSAGYYDYFDSQTLSNKGHALLDVAGRDGSNDNFGKAMFDIDHVWLGRGGSASQDDAGIFAFETLNGQFGNIYSYRVVLTPLK